MPFLIQLDGNEEVIHRLAGVSVTVGRAESSDIRLTSQTVSGQHARLSGESGIWRITDTNSSHGTFLNGRVIQAWESQPLTAGDYIEIGDCCLEFAQSLDDRAKSVTSIILRLKDGDTAAAAEVWNQYFDKVVSAARRKLNSMGKKTVEDEDVAVSVFASLCRGAAAGNFSRMSDRNDLWALLLTITRQKVVDRIRHANARKRGGGHVRGESVFNLAADGSLVIGIDQIAGKEPTPEEIAGIDEECQQLVALLPNDLMRRIVELRLLGHAVEEIAAELGCTGRWIEKNLQEIRTIWLRQCVENEEANS